MLGGSIALRARNLGLRVIGYDPSQAALHYARSVSILDEAAAEPNEVIAAADALVLAAPVDGILTGLDQLVRHPEPALVQRLQWIIDVASVKGPVVEAGRPLANFLGTHPMAGSEQQGPQAARRDLFVGRPWALTPIREFAGQPAVTAFIEALGARPVVVDAAEHDRIVAATSHVPQLLASILAAGLAVEQYHGLFGTGLASMTRLSRSPWSMWRSIVETNSAAIIAELESHEASIRAVIHALAAADLAVVENIFSQAAHNRGLLERSDLAR